MEGTVRIMCIRKEFPTNDTRNIVPYTKYVRIITWKSFSTVSSVLVKIELKLKFDRLVNMVLFSELILETLFVVIFHVVFLFLFFFRYLDCRDFRIRLSHLLSHCFVQVFGKIIFKVVFFMYVWYLFVFHFSHAPEFIKRAAETFFLIKTSS